MPDHGPKNDIIKLKGIWKWKRNQFSLIPKKRKWLIKMGFASRFASAYVSESRKDSKRRQRELEQRGKREAAADEVDVYENYLERLIGLHKESRGYINWGNTVNINPPVKPIRNSINENKAREKWESYKPGFFDRLFKWQEKRKNKLFNNIEQEKIMDDKVFKEEWGKYSDIKRSTERNLFLRPSGKKGRAYESLGVH